MVCLKGFLFLKCLMFCLNWFRSLDWIVAPAAGMCPPAFAFFRFLIPTFRSFAMSIFFVWFLALIDIVFLLLAVGVAKIYVCFG